MLIGVCSAGGHCLAQALIKIGHSSRGNEEEKLGNVWSKMSEGYVGHDGLKSITFKLSCGTWNYQIQWTLGNKQTTIVGFAALGPLLVSLFKSLFFLHIVLSLMDGSPRIYLCSKY